jgi:hypothetical protein
MPAKTTAKTTAKPQNPGLSVVKDNVAPFLDLGAPSAPSTPPAETISYKVSKSYIGKPLEVVTEGEYSQLSEELQGLKRCAKLVGEEYDLQAEIYKSEGKRIVAETEKVNVQTKLQGYQQASLKLQQAQTKTQIEQVHLQTVQRDLLGYREESQLKSDTWDIKLDNLRNDVALAREAFAQKRQAILERRG